MKDRKNWMRRAFASMSALALALVLACGLTACQGAKDGQPQGAGSEADGDAAAGDGQGSEAGGDAAAGDGQGSKAGTDEADADVGDGAASASDDGTQGSEGMREVVTIKDKAYESFSSFIDAYYFTSKITEGVGSLVGDNMFFWEPAEMYEIMIDAYEHTGDQRYYDMIFEFFEGFKLEHGEDWSWNEYNDDIAWMTLACTRAYNCTGDQRFLDIAVKHFNIVWERGLSDDLGGGIW